MAGILVTDKYRVVKNMNLAPNNRKIKFSTMDFVRTGTLELMAYEINEKQNKPGGIVVIILAILGFIFPTILLFLLY